MFDPSEGQATVIGLAPTTQPRPLRRADIVLQHVGTDAILIDVRNDQAHVLNGSAARLWELCDGERSVDAVATAFGEPFGMSGDDVVGDVRDGLAELAGLDLLEAPA